MGTLLAILGLIPSLIKAVQAAEEFAPLPGQGKAKLDLVLGIITDVYSDAAKLIPQITVVVARLVSFANTLGLFGKPALPPTV
jgi:hypothetical protein